MRRGLRVRTPAQQRPYFHHSKLFEETEEGAVHDDDTKSPPKSAPSKLAQVVYADNEDSIVDYAREQESNEHIQPPSASSEKKSKAKPKWGRPKKAEFNEDPEFHAPVTIQAVSPSNDPKPRRKRKQKSFQLSEMYVQDSSEEGVAVVPRTTGVEEELEEPEPSPVALRKPQKAPARRRSKPKKSASIIVSSDEDDDEGEGEGEGENVVQDVAPRAVSALPSSSPFLSQPPTPGVAFTGHANNSQRNDNAISKSIHGSESSDMELLNSTPERESASARNTRNNRSPAAPLSADQLSSDVDFLSSNPEVEAATPVRKARKRKGGDIGADASICELAPHPQP